MYMTFSRLNLFFLFKDTKKNKKPSYFHKFFITFAQTFSKRALFAPICKKQNL